MGNLRNDEGNDEQCPSLEFKKGEPNGRCWGDGHYSCNECVNFREDFKRLGQNYIDFLHTRQGGVVIRELV